MTKTRKTVLLSIRLAPEQKRAAEDLADRLGLNMTDIVRISLNETIDRANGTPAPYIIFPIDQKRENKPA